MIKTSEWVSLGHPDKVADYIPSCILDAFLEKDPNTRYAVEVLIKNEFVYLGGEVTSKADFNWKSWVDFVRDAIRRLNHESGVTILISSHLLDELSKVATKYGILNEGKLVEEITTEELEERCRHNVTMIVDDPVRARQLLSEMIPAEDLSVEQHKLTVYSHTDQAAAFNRKLVTSGIDVYELTTHTRGVEDFFIERIGG